MQYTDKLDHRDLRKVPGESALIMTSPIIVYNFLLAHFWIGCYTVLCKSE